jgi:hypothetical protein
VGHTWESALISLALAAGHRGRTTNRKPRNQAVR